ncbi:hypothetical protein ACIQ6V_15585 [Streptomyces sp. NPDC096198]|uniref:hypothetical protein n=1 Tax=Streptomyces sp. NPDC096198 TaxID=3366080 RepID=UPI0038017D4F
MARNFFGGTAADSAENESGGRLPNLKGRVYASEESPDVITDLLDPSGKELKDGILTDERGMIPPFQGPNGAEQLWVDFNAGRVMLTPNDTGKRLSSHLADPDPHRSIAYTNEALKGYVAKAGSNSCQPAKDGPLFNVEAPFGAGDVLAVNRDGVRGSVLKGMGALYLKTFGDFTPLVVTNDSPTNKPSVTLNDGAGNNTLRFYKNGDVDTRGSVTVAGDVTASGAVLAANIGTARVYSGTADPATQGVQLKPGDIWVSYGG